MARIRIGGVGPQSPAAYVQPAEPEWPVAVADLERVPGWCHTADSVAQCPSPGPGIVCTDCAVRELGESWSNLKARTNAGTPKGIYYSRLDRAQSVPDPVFRRAQEWARRRRLTP